MSHRRFVVNSHISFTVVIFFFITFLCIFPYPFLLADTIYSVDLKKRIDPIIKNISLKDVSFGIQIVSVKENIPLFSYCSDDVFRVASNMKLLTTAAALEYLGPDFEYTTYVETQGTITGQGTLMGDIVIRGSGDPNLSGRFFDDNILAVPEFWGNAVKNRGIYKITGDVIADDSIFDRVYVSPHWPENQLSNWYCAQTCGLSFNDNCVDITLTPEKKPGKPVLLFIEPNTSYFTIFNNCICTSNKKEHKYSVYRRPETNQIFISGKFWVGAPSVKQWVSIHNPALYLATVFKEVLERYGITVCGDVRLTDKTDILNTRLERIAQTISTMGQTISVTNKRSQNFYAEQILKTLGAQIHGNGSSESGIDVMRNFMNKLGFHPDEYQIEDGSGLSRGNKLSPEMITALLTYMAHHRHGKVFYDSLPVSGVDGSLKRRMSSPPYKNKVHAKTGYIAKTSSLSGYIDTANGDILAFSILMNNFKSLHDMRKIQDTICQVLVDSYN
ncbi:MAG: D-alanyl-D-alanine carboxypeptidase/D-alanyl-D-alanine-endopeptidase [wastewater metagenome]|nr:D-alanyl-D-alanine carboxypeptidase/D-alanyl-D-alanine-endopeptidase [Candidatus Loosdrechtia aerotolerans]